MKTGLAKAKGEEDATQAPRFVDAFCRMWRIEPRVEASRLDRDVRDREGPFCV